MKHLMRLLLVIILVTNCTFAFSDASERQIYGSYAFVSLTEDFSYSFDIGEYVSRDKNILVGGVRVFESIDNLKKNYQNPNIEQLNIKTGNNTYRMKQHVQGKDFYSYTALIGDSDESAIVNVVFANQSNLKEQEIMATEILTSLIWKKTSGLNFDKAIYFKLDNLQDLSPSVVMGTRVVFTQNGTSFLHTKFYLSVSAFPNQSKISINGIEREIADYFSLQLSATANVTSKEYGNITVASMPGVRVFREYEDNNEKIKDKTAVLLSDDKVYVIEMVSKDRSYDDYINRYDSILESFSIER